MSTRIGTNTIKFVHEIDPKVVIANALGDIESFEVHGPRILVAVYEPPINERGESKIQHGTLTLIAPETSGGTKDEYKWQGRVGLVIKKGPLAFKDDAENKFAGDDVSVGDWIVMNPMDGRAIGIGKQLCRVINDHHVQMTVPHPDAVY